MCPTSQGRLRWETEKFEDYVRFPHLKHPFLLN